VTLGGTLLVKGYINSGGSTFYTNGAGTLFSSVAGEDNTSAADYQISTFAIPAENRVQTFSNLSLQIAGGTTRTCRIKFNTGSVIISGPAIDRPSVEISIT
jgi:hypothetical protein